MYFKNCKRGLSRIQIIDKVSKEMNLNKKQMLEIVNQELKRRIKINEDYEERQWETKGTGLKILIL